VQLDRDLIDVSEWGSEARLHVPILITKEVDVVLATIPWSDIRDVTYADRVTLLIYWAALAFERLRLAHRIQPGEEIDEDLTLEFCAPLKTRAGDHPFRWFELAYGCPKGDGLTIRIRTSTVERIRGADSPAAPRKRELGSGGVSFRPARESVGL